MATLVDVQAALDSLNAKADAAKVELDAEIARVEALIAAGAGASAADLQKIVDGLSGVSSKVDALGTEAAGERP